MEKINIKKLRNNGETFILGTFILDDAQNVLYEGDKVFGENVKKEGIYRTEHGVRTKVLINDGERFFSSLENHFRSPYLFAQREK